MNYPPLPILNDNDEPIGRASLQEIHEQGLLHRIVLIIIRDPGGKILLQRRGPHVATNANRWDVSAAGHVDLDEAYEAAAARELSEELGINKAELTELAYFHTYAVVSGKKLNRFVKIYMVTLPADTRFSINSEEVSEIRWFDPNELKAEVGKHPEEFNNDFEEILAKVTSQPA